MNMNEIITSTVLTKVCSLKPFKNSPDTKQVTLAVKYDGLTLGDIFTKALRADVISWQNGPGRKGYDNLIDKSTVNVSAKAPGATAIDPETAMVALLMTKTPEEQIIYLKDLAAKAAGVASKPAMTVKKVEAEPTDTSDEIMEEVVETE